MLNNSDIRLLTSQLHGHTKKFHQNEIVMRNTSGEIGLILSGIVYFCTENDLFDYNILDFYRTGDLIDSAILFPITNGICYLKTKYPTEITYIDKRNLKDFYNKNPNWQEKLMHFYFLKMKLNNLDRCYILHQKSIRSKLLCFFANEHKIQGTSSITLPIPYVDLANYLAVDRTAMMKEIHRMKSDKLISGKNHALTLHGLS